MLIITLGRWLESTERKGKPIGDIWNDYHFNVPNSDSKSKEERVLRNAQLANAMRRHRICRNGTNYEYDCNCGKVRCSYCDGVGQIDCNNCDGCGGFLHIPILRVEWSTRTNTQYVQNSFLPSKRIEKGQRSYF